MIVHGLILLLYLSIGFGVWLVGLLHGDFDPSDHEDGGPGIISCCFFWPVLIVLNALVIIVENAGELAITIQSKVRKAKNKKETKL